MGTPKKPENGQEFKLPMARTNFYVQEYRDRTLNTKLGKIKTSLTDSEKTDHGQTDGKTGAKFKVLTNSSTNQKCNMHGKRW